MLKALITDPLSKIQAAVIDDSHYQYNTHHGLVVYTDELKHYDNAPQYFLNELYGDEIAQDASAGGTPLEVHNGIDDILWTATDIVGGGKTTFNSTDRSYTGTNSVKVDNSPVGDVFQFDKGSDLDCSGYVSISMWINVDKDWKAGDTIELYGWDTGIGLQVGDAVDLSDYFTYNQYDVWHKLSIPLTDMGALAAYATLDALRVRIVTAEGKSAKFYMDVMQFEQTGTPIEYSIAPSKNTLLHVLGFNFFYADAYAGTLADATMPNIPYDKFFALASLNTGIVYQRIQDESVTFSTTWHDHSDLMTQPGSIITGCGSDGTNSWVSILNKLVTPIILDDRKKDKISLTISDDLSGLLSFRVGILAKTESL
jgi:hypothetical protein